MNPLSSVKEPSSTHPPPVRPVRLNGFCSGVKEEEGMKRPLAPKPVEGDGVRKMDQDSMGSDESMSMNQSQ